MMDRRRFVGVGAAAAVGTLVPACRSASPPLWDASAFRLPARSRVAVLSHSRYDGGLRDTVTRGLELLDVDVRGRRVLLKPNLVEFDPGGVINTHPDLISATIEAFRALGAGELLVAEGPGHRRDNEYLLDASGLAYALSHTAATYVDLNTDSVRKVALRSRFTGLGALYLPETLLNADLVVSMPKLKTHKWVGATLSMKNMFGVIPGAVYGWPKNVLHWHGIAQSIIDINAAITVQRLNIVDGITGMEGNGPIQGDARHSGVLVFGADGVAVDATCARLMRLDPERMPYLNEAGAFLGNVAGDRIQQLGEDPDAYAQDYRVLEQFRHLKV